MSISLQKLNLIEATLKRYEPEIQLMRGEKTIPNYHSNLPEGEYCMTSKNAEFALDLLCCENPQYHAIANNILRKHSSLQRKEGELRGLWSYYYEESLDKMHAPDWNYADFNAIPLIKILIEHSEKLEEGVYEILKDSVINACYAIIKRNLTIIYTNPTVMNVYATVVCGEMFDIPEFVEFGKTKLERFYRHIMASRTFDEYNCPGYSLLIAQIFPSMLKHIKDADVCDKINQLNSIVWEMLGKHFHVKTGELSGPNFRRYVNFFSDEQLSEYKRATGVDLISDEDMTPENLLYSPKCPEELTHYFTENHSEDYSILYTRGNNYPWFNQPIIDSLYMTDDYTIGSFSLMDGWNQRSSLAAYFGDRKEKCCIRLRILHDFYDFSSGATATVQHKGSAITVANFHTNHGDTHVDLDPIINNTIRAKDLRVRFQIEANCTAAAEKITVCQEGSTCVVNAFGEEVVLGFPAIEMSGENTKVEVTRNGKEIFVDAVLYSGEEKSINLKAYDSLYVVSTISIGENKLSLGEIVTDDTFVTATADLNGKTAEIKALRKAEEQIPSTMATKMFVDGERFEAYAEV